MGSVGPVLLRKKKCSLRVIAVLLLTMMPVLACNPALDGLETGGNTAAHLDGGEVAFPEGGDASIPSGMNPNRDDENVPEYAPQPPQLRRLTNKQYRHAMLDFFGLELPPTFELGTNTQLHGYRNIASAILSMSETEVEAYESAGQWIAQQLVAARDPAVFEDNCELHHESCIESSITRLGALLWKRSMTDVELQAFMETWRGLLNQPFNHEERTEVLISALLQSPYFLYVAEVGEVNRFEPTARRRTSQELLAATTLLIWDVPPNAEQLLQYGTDLYDEARYDALLDSLLNDERAQRGLLGFFEEYLLLDRLSNVEKSRVHFPLMSDTIAEAFRHEALGMINSVIFEERQDVRHLLTTRETFLNWELAQLYNVTAGVEFEHYEFANSSPRKGFLTTGAFLALNAHHSTTSPTYRGKYVQNRFYCFDVPPPPEGVDTTLDPVEEGRPESMRERVAQHNDDPVCSGCHQFMDPIGLAFENFDALGAWRTDEGGLPIDPSGTLHGFDFRNHHELIDHLATQTVFAECVTRQFVRYAWNRLELDSDEPILAELDEQFARSGYAFDALVRAVVKNRAFRELSEVSSE